MAVTNKTRIVDILEFFPHNVRMPYLSTYELAIQAACKLTLALRNPAHAAPSAHIGHKQHEALHRLTMIFKEIAAPEPQQAKSELPAEAPSDAQSSSMPTTEIPVNNPSQVTTSMDNTQQHSSPPRVNTSRPRVGQATPRIPSPPTTLSAMKENRAPYTQQDGSIHTPKVSRVQLCKLIWTGTT
jgi:hypothetical protein